MKTNKVRKILRVFYDTYGWKREEVSGRYLGEVLHEESNKIAQGYININEMRYRKCFSGGSFFLDAACGAKPRQYMAQNFQKHVCVDVSLLGLTEARKQLGEIGLYVIGDLVTLPFKEKLFDGVLASHCLYHIDKEMQHEVLSELYRVAKPDKTILVFYASNYNLVSIAHIVGNVIIKGIRMLFKLLRRDGKHWKSEIKMAPLLYCYTHNPVRLTKGFNHRDISCLQSLTLREIKMLKKLHLLKFVVPMLSFMESKFPHSMRYIGKYVTIKIQREC